MIPLVLFLRKRKKKREGEVYNNENQMISGTHLVYIFICIAQIQAITKPDRFDCKLQTEGLINTYGHTVKRQDIQHTVAYTACRRADSGSQAGEQSYHS